MHRRQHQGEEVPGRMHPTGLEAGTQVEDWRLLGRHEAGSFGVVYLAVRVGAEAAGPCALKLARARGDARLSREVGLLGRVRHPNVPRLQGHGEWYGFPYVVTEWVEGVSLSRWTRLCNPSGRQVTRLLAKLAGALAAVHAVGGAHRDIKSENVLVRLEDGEPMLTDFGAGTWEGAAPLTVNGPPGTPLYYSPERLRAHLNLLPPGAPSGAGPADDVYGLGVTAFRLLTDTYPFTELEEEQRTQERLRGRLPRAPHEVNPGVPVELSAWVMRLLAARPEERPSMWQVAEALSKAQENTPEQPLFAWETDPERLGPGRRLASRMEYELLLVRARAEENQARVAAEIERAQAEREAPPPSEPESLSPPHPKERKARSRRARAQQSWLAAVGLVVLALGVWWSSEVPSPAPADDKRDAGTVGLGDTPLPAPSRAVSSESERSGMGLDMPMKPLPGQRGPPCRKPAVEIYGGCWVAIEEQSPPCSDDAYAWKNRCYWPIRGPQKPATSDLPESPGER
ncbi:serine/threonine protein kinase [Hyalangium rubrum]|uniref:Serine/threonine-protein kinase n=1 Tax=Hyalangium rubrum TaxID=3103134 RepID=A0ABU5HDE6_9BACT|nr:serine/threonine-protein kinase [Hyalangium sp. s54d21]MDY7231286.1 serine/threonine-protein kinase [Hyalangium sp. s54d21]